jgi:D-serine deaminase-like pyridoxal phosphate-dependent protein
MVLGDGFVLGRCGEALPSGLYCHSAPASDNKPIPTTPETNTMTTPIGQPIDSLDSPQLLIDLDIVDANLGRMFAACRERGVAVRVHFKSLKCTGLARYIAAAGANGFLCAKLNEAEALVDAGLTDVLIANQIVGPIKLRRLAELARRAQVCVCVDDADNVAQLAQAARTAGSTIGVLVEVDIGMGRCGVEPGEPALALARQVHDSSGLRFDGLQGYDGHLQLLADVAERRAKCLHGLERLIGTRRLIEKAGIPVRVVTGAGTGTWEFVSSFEGMTEIQPGSFVLMDCAYHAVRPEFACSLSVRATVISRRPGQYVLDAGSKAISRDFGTPVIKDRPGDRVLGLSEEHTRVQTEDKNVRIGDRYEVIPAHCCATMNLHRNCVAVRKGRVEALWPIEASGRYD